MPQPVPHITGCTTSASNVLHQEPTCVALVGAVAMAWSDVEDELVHVLGHGMGEHREVSPGSFQGDYSWIARVAVREAETIRTRIKLIDAALQPMLRGTAYFDEWEALAKLLRRRSADRNRVVHGRWGVSEEAPGALLERSESVFVRWTESDLRDVLQRLVEVWRELYAFRNRLVEGIARGEIAPPRS